MSQSVLITGASGFLGAAVARACLRAGADVLPVTRRYLPGMVHVDDYSEAPAADVLVHLAEDNDRARVASAGAVYEACASQTLDALLQKGYGRIVYASSAVLYGGRETSLRRPLDPVHMVDAYTRIKGKSEAAVLATGKGVVVRLANLYGAGMSVNNVISTILGQIPGQGPLEVMDATPVRDFVAVEDAAAALAAMALWPGKPGIYNVGSGEALSIGALARLALDLAGETDRQIVSTRAAAESSCIVLDISQTIAQWQWRPATSMKDALGQLMRARK